MNNKAIEMFFEGNIPSLKNSKQVVCRWKIPTVLPSKAYSKWHKEQKDIFKSHIYNLGKWPFMFEYFFKIPLNKDWSVSKRWWDYTNKMESINDFLVDLKVIADDNCDVIRRILVDWEYTKSWDAWCYLRITELTPNQEIEWVE